MAVGSCKSCRGGCDPGKTLPAQIPALNYGAKPTTTLSNQCWERCSAAETSGKHFSDSALKFVQGMAQDNGIVKALIYGGLHVSGVLPDWDVDYACKSTFDLIVLKCPRGYFKSSACRLNADYFTRSNPLCAAAYDGLGKNNGEYRCAVVNWWDTCCSTKQPQQDDDCPQCGQDQYFCT